MNHIEIQSPEEIKASLMSDTLPPLEDVIYDISFNRCFDLLPLFIEKYNLKEDSFNQAELIFALTQLDLQNSDNFTWPSENDLYKTPELMNLEFSNQAQFEAIKRIVKELKEWKDTDEEAYLNSDGAMTMIAYLDEMCDFLKLPLMSGWVEAMDVESDLLDEAMKASVIESLGQFKDEYKYYLRSLGMGSEPAPDNAPEMTSPSNADVMNGDEGAPAPEVNDLDFE